MDPWAVFIDVDGTLVDNRGLVPDSARSAVQSARANGHLVFLCTGRSLSELWQEVVDVGFDGVIAAAGGYVEVGGRVLSHRHIPVPQLRRVLELFDAHGVEYMLESNSGIYGSAHSRERLRHLLFGRVTDEDVLAELERGLGGFVDSLVVGADNLRGDINKVAFLDSPLPIEAIRAELGDAFDVMPGSVPMFGQSSGELSMRGVTKGAAIELLIGELGLPRERTLALGDGLNDLEMLAFVAVGIAMGNAGPRVRAVADEVTGTPHEHGIRTALQRHGLI